LHGFFKLILSIFICFLPGIIGSVFSYESVNTWYNTINKPAFNPPDYIFAPAWAVLYFIMGISLFLIWKEGLQNKNVRSAFIIFIIQLLFNGIWSVIFFGLQSITGGFIVIMLLLVLIFLCIIRFKKISPLSGYLLVPYFLWVVFAAILNVFIFILN